MSEINAKIPAGALAEKWTNYKNRQKLANPANRHLFDITIVGIGLVGASAAVPLGELGFNVLNFCIQDSPQCVHSITTQDGINAVKDYRDDGDPIYRLYYDIIKGGDYRACGANVYRLAEVSDGIIDQCVVQDAPSAREYGGLLDNHSFGGAQVPRTLHTRDQIGQQLLLGAYSALSRQVYKGSIKLYMCHGAFDLVIMNGRARDIIMRDLITSTIERSVTYTIVIATGGYSNAFHLTINAIVSNGSAVWQYYKKGVYFDNPCTAQIHPTCAPEHGDLQSKLMLMSKSLRNNGRIWVPKKLEDAKAPQVGTKETGDIPEEDHGFYLERRYLASGNLVPCDVANRVVKECCDAGLGINDTGLAVFLDFRYAIGRIGHDVAVDKYGNLFQMYKQIVADNPHETPMMIYPAIRYTVGGLWVDHELQTTIPEFFTTGEANSFDRGADRLSASTPMQDLADGYFILPYTIQNYLSDQIQVPHFSVDHKEFDKAEKTLKERIQHIAFMHGKRSIDSIHKESGHIMWKYVGMIRSKEGLQIGVEKIKALRRVFRSDPHLPGNIDDLNIEPEKALCLADFPEIGELMVHDALDHEESCGGHFRIGYQTEEGEAKYDDENFTYVLRWEYQGRGQDPVMHKESPVYEFTERLRRNYKD